MDLTMYKPDERPPYVTFGMVPVEDRNASIAAGSYVAKDVEYAFITPQGSKDRIERVASEWLTQLRKDMAEGRFKPEWYQQIETAYKMWKEGQEIPVNGTPLLNWPVAPPGVVRTLVGVGIRTVEDLASCSEEAIGRIGMGGRVLQQRARDWVRAAEGPGKLTAEVAAIRAENANLKVRNEELEGRLVALERAAKLESPVKIEAPAEAIKL